MKNKIFSSLLAMLGFASCNPFSGGGTDTPDMYGVPVPEYGAPYADFVIKGKVSGEGAGELEGIQVVLKPYKENDYANETISTDAAGGYEIRKQWWDSSGNFTVQVIAEDIDGDANGGSFAKKETDVTFAQSDFTGGSGWHEGSAVKNLDITLEKETDTPDEK